MALLGSYKVVLAPAILAGVLLLLALSPVGAGRQLDQDEEVWWALRQLGAEPVGTSLEGQFLLAAGEEQGFLSGDLVLRLLPGATLRTAAAGERVWGGPDGSVLSLSWQAHRGLALPGAPADLRTGQERLAAGPTTLLILRLDQLGQGNPSRLARELAAWADRGPIYQTYVARLTSSPPGPALEREARRLIGLLGGRTREGLRQGNWASFSGYSPRLGPGRRTVAGTLLNVQVALRTEKGHHATLVYVGVPLLPGSY